MTKIKQALKDYMRLKMPEHPERGEPVTEDAVVALRMWYIGQRHEENGMVETKETQDRDWLSGGTTLLMALIAEMGGVQDFL